MPRTPAVDCGFCCRTRPEDTVGFWTERDWPKVLNSGIAVTPGTFRSAFSPGDLTAGIYSWRWLTDRPGRAPTGRDGAYFHPLIHTPRMCKADSRRGRREPATGASRGGVACCIR